MNELLEYAQSLIRFLERKGSTLNLESQRALGDLLQNTLQLIQEQSQNEQNEPPTQPANTATNQLGSAPSPDAQLLWILAGQQPQAFLSYLRSFPTPATNQLLANPQQLNSTIAQLQQMLPEGEPPVIDGIPHSDLNSSNVWGAVYDPRSGTMRVRFQGGSEYEYDGIPSNIFKALIKGNAAAKTKGKNEYGQWWPGKTPSMGAALNQYIKAGKFNYRKIK